MLCRSSAPVSLVRSDAGGTDSGGGGGLGRLLGGGYGVCKGLEGLLDWAEEKVRVVGKIEERERALPWVSRV